MSENGNFLEDLEKIFLGAMGVVVGFEMPFKNSVKRFS